MCKDLDDQANFCWPKSVNPKAILKAIEEDQTILLGEYHDKLIP